MRSNVSPVDFEAIPLFLSGMLVCIYNVLN